MGGRTLTGPKAEVHPNVESQTQRMLVEMGRAPAPVEPKQPKPKKAKADPPTGSSEAEVSVELLPLSKPPTQSNGRPWKPGQSGNPNGLVLFSKVKEARKALLAAAEDIRDLYMRSIVEAIAEGEYAAAQQGLQWLMEHMPADEDGTKMIDQNIDKPKVDSGKSAPQINIGVALGGMLNGPRALPAASIIDVKELKDVK